MIEAGQYYAAIQQYNDIPVGELIYILETDPIEGVSFLCGEQHFVHEDSNQIDLHFKHEPNGAKIRQQQMAEAMQQLHEINAEACAERTKVLEFNPQVNLIADESETDKTPTTSLTTNHNRVAQTKKLGEELERHSTQIDKYAKRIDLARKRLESLMIEQKNAIAGVMSSLKEHIRKAHEVLWTFSVYLGDEEEIIELRDGEPAPADELICVRQLVLHMDEECMVHAEEGGIDFSSIEKFDEWLLEPGNLDQILPEKKGVVALKPRRKNKCYEDSHWVSAKKNEANKKTYFLIRNGENIYRAWTNLEVDETMFPTEREFDEMFKDRWRQGPDGEPLYYKPGTSDYMEAMKRAEKQQRHYMVVLLFLQGLIDRTEVFRPFNGDQINIMDRKSNSQYMRYVYDAERLIGHGRPEFKEWVRNANSKLDVGHRAIGAFTSYILQGEEARIRPKTASAPNSYVLHTIERIEGSGFVFLYERTGKIAKYDGWYFAGEKDPERRASFKIYKDDEFVLDFDAVGVEDMVFYLTDRISRHNYIHMIPLLKASIAAKQREVAEEAPFKELLMLNFVKTYNIDEEEAQRAVNELVQWWKYKTRTFRALVSNDKRAYKMIIAEYGHRKSRKNAFNDALAKRVIDAIKGVHPDVLYIAHKRNNEFAAFVPSEPHRNIFVTEQVWTCGGEIVKTSEKTWKVVDKRRERWGRIYASERWNNWRCDVSKANNLTGPERESLVQRVIEKASEMRWKYAHYENEEHKGTPTYIPLRVICRNVLTIEIFAVDKLPYIENRSMPFSSKRSNIPNIGRTQFTWMRKANGIEISNVSNGHVCDFNEWFAKWCKECDVLWEDEKAINDWYGKIGDFNDWLKIGRDIVRRAGCYETQVVSAIQEREHAAETKRFMDKYNDNELCKEHMSKFKQTTHRLFAFKEACSLIIEAGENPSGMTVGQVIERAKLLGFDEPMEDIPMDCVLTDG